MDGKATYSITEAQACHLARCTATARLSTDEQRCESRPPGNGECDRHTNPATLASPYEHTCWCSVIPVMVPADGLLG